MKPPNEAGRGQMTRKAIQQAILRIEKGRTKVVSADREMSIAAVAEEAGFSRATIHNNHPDLAERVNALRDKSARTTRDRKHVELQDERAKGKEYRREIAELREANTRMATQVAMLTHEVEQLRAETASSKVVSIRR